jgi:hypothetical protein
LNFIINKTRVHTHTAKAQAATTLGDITLEEVGKAAKVVGEAATSAAMTGTTEQVTSEQVEQGQRLSVVVEEEEEAMDDAD